jgi:soluble lytic murein transglycosylase-like protein
MKLGFLVSVLFIQAAAAQPACPTTPPSKMPDAALCWAEYYAGVFGVPTAFVQAIIDVESAWQPYVVSSKGAAGLMQLTAPTALTFGVTNRFRIDENIRGGVAYIAYLVRQFDGELRLVAAAYYAGEKRVKKSGLQYANADVCRYVARVQRFYRNRRQVVRPLPKTQPKE